MKKVAKRYSKAEFASAKELMSLQPASTNTVYYEHNIALANCPRLSVVASAYQYFRITKVVYKFKPMADTFISGVAGGQTGSIPYLYWLLDKGYEFRGLTFNQLRNAGAKPIRFDDKSISVSWKPTVLMNTNNVSDEVAGAPPGLNIHRTSPWMSTEEFPGVFDPTKLKPFTPSAVPHHGLIFGVQQDNAAMTTLQYDIDIEYHVQFRKPRIVGPSLGDKNVDIHTLDQVPVEPLATLAAATVEA